MMIKILKNSLGLHHLWWIPRKPSLLGLSVSSAAFPSPISPLWRPTPSSTPRPVQGNIKLMSLGHTEHSGPISNFNAFRRR